ncbi:MAG: hypothetical protein ACOCRZ_01090 [Halothermotrichaceae bacterium]
MSENITINQQKKIIISGNNSSQSVEISKSAVNNGFLKNFSGPGLAIFLYLITHINDSNYLETNPTIISSYISNSYTIDDIKKSLKDLEKNNIIKISPKRKGSYTYKITIQRINARQDFTTKKDTNAKKTIDLKKYFNRTDLRQQVLTTSSPGREKLFLAILTFVPPGTNIEMVETEIINWLNTFDTKMIKELIRRVDKWIKKYDNPPEEAYNYLRGIVDDWYQKEIDDYQGLQHFDQLYRETKELAAVYGFKEWHNVKPAHMETFKSWLTEDFPLSLPVIKFAIKEAFKRKSDGQPSLTYIENNFIKPFKKSGVKNLNNAKSVVYNKSSSKKYSRANYQTKASGKKAKKKNKNWENLHWDFERRKN